MPNKISPKTAVVVIITVLAFLVGGGYLWQKMGAPAARGELVGVTTADGATYFGILVLADKKSVVLRDVYTAGGYYTPSVEEGQPSPKPQFRVNKGGVGAPGAAEGEDTLVIPRSRVLFISRDLSSQVAEAIRTWVPPTPAPTPAATLVPAPGETEAPVSAVTPAPVPTLPSRVPVER
jgi:hypothetical protein